MNSGKLSEKVLKLKQEINSVGHNYPLLYLNIGFIEKMEIESQVKNYRFNSYINTMHTLVDKCLIDYEDYHSFVNLKDSYSEALVLSIMSSVVSIDKITESTSKSPDFRIMHNGATIFLEMKTLNMADGTLKHKEIMEVAFDGKMQLERQIEEQKRTAKKEGNIVASVVRHDMPYYTPNRPYDSSSIKLVVETLIDKIRQNIKEEQFKLGDTLLLLNFSDQLGLLESPEESLRENYIGEYRDNSALFDYIASNDMSLEQQTAYLDSVEAVLTQTIYPYKAKGCLWHAAFGDIGTILREASPSDEITEEVLDRQGILKEYDFIKGILFYIDGKFYACMKGLAPNSVFQFFSYLSDMKLVENNSFSSLNDFQITGVVD